ncbi:hypothetical protein DY000_02062043 [Brassica cretica]|uniref:Uncharacterized protein n=1 Tax=Brassica cretica TaxID=69181 RepID=A0ABQ7ATX0_BRACR|nr:hypothetical protein DY000_02062043 [Brassica cretica]
MESIGVLMMCPMNSYLENELQKRYNLHRFWTCPEKSVFLETHRNSIRAIVGNASAGADAKLIDDLPKLEIISSFSVGVDKIDLGKCKEKGIRVTNTPEVLTEDVADLAIGLILALLRRLCECDRYFSGKSVGIIGLGRIGAAIAKRAQGFSCPINYYSRTEKPDVGYKYYPTVVELAQNSDILVVACALTDETRHIVNREVIDALGAKGVLINIGRGPHVDEKEMVKALTEGRLGGAGLDVFEQEPHVPEELFGLENVVLLPHVASATVETRTAMADLVLGALSYLYMGENVVLLPHVASATVETRTAMADLVLGNLEAHFAGKPLLTPVV